MFTYKGFQKANEEKPLEDHASKEGAKAGYKSRHFRPDNLKSNQRYTPQYQGTASAATVKKPGDTKPNIHRITQKNAPTRKGKPTLKKKIPNIKPKGKRFGGGLRPGKRGDAGGEKRQKRVVMKIITLPIRLIPKIVKMVTKAPVMLGVMAVIIILILIFLLVSAIPTCAPKNEFKDVQLVYEHITELDTDMRVAIRSAGREDAIKRYFLNDSEAQMDDLIVYTDAEMLIAYLTVMYQGLTLFDLKREAEGLHSLVHQLQINEWEEVEVIEVETDEEGETETIIIITYFCNVILTTASLQDTLDNHRAEYLTEDENSIYDTLMEVGFFIMWQELGSPFKNHYWPDHVSSRQGWRIHPMSDRKEYHNGIDIALPLGTEVVACHSGIVTTGENEIAGRWVKITAKNSYTDYNHLGTISVQEGQRVKAGDVIGTVGSTGRSTGPHLHLTYCRGNRIANPGFFLER